MEVFEWEKYLNSFSMLPFSTENEQFYSPRDLKIRCWIIDEKIRINMNILKEVVL